MKSEEWWSFGGWRERCWRRRDFEPLITRISQILLIVKVLWITKAFTLSKQHAEKIMRGAYKFHECPAVAIFSGCFAAKGM
jgi:hypothetical protein